MLTLAAAVALLSCKPAPPPAPAEPKGTPTPAATPPARHPQRQRRQLRRRQRRYSATTAFRHPFRLNACRINARQRRRPGAGFCEPGLKDPVATVDGDQISKAQLDEAFDKAVQMTGIKARILRPSKS